MSAKRARFIRLWIHDELHIFELGTIEPGSLDIDNPVLCKCCHEPMTAAIDITQYGFFEDKFILLFTCHACGKAFWYAYTLGTVELTELAAEITEAEVHSD